MKQEFLSYFSEIGLSDKLIAIVEKRMLEVSSIFGDEIKRVFICNNYSNQQQVFTSLWFFSETKAFECKNFVSKDDYDVVVFHHRVAYINIMKSHYSDLEEPTDESKLNATCYFQNVSVSCLLNAVGVNSKYLMCILKNVFLNNVV